MAAARGKKLHRAIDRYVGIPLVYGMGLLRRPRPRPQRVEQIGLLALGAIGDLLLSVGSSVPALRKVYPDARIVLFTSSTNKAAIPLLPPVDAIELLKEANLPQAVRTLNSYNLDVLVDFGPWPRISAIQSALCNAKFVVGFATKGQHRHYSYDAVAEHKNTVHELDNYAALIAKAGVDTVEPPRIVLSPEILDRVSRPGGNPFVVCHPWPAGFRCEMRAWPNDYWHRFAAALIERGYDIAFTGGPGDRASADELLAGLDLPADRIFDLTGRMKLDETAALLSKAAAVVSVNTGIMHVAAALDRPMLALHGPTNPVRWGPLSDKAVALLPNAPNVAYLNLGFEYPADVEPCMHLLTVDEVVAAFDKLTATHSTQI